MNKLNVQERKETLLKTLTKLCGWYELDEITSDVNLLYCPIVALIFGQGL